MKVIDLLNKIANGEEVPKLIMTSGERFVLIDYGKDTKIYQMIEEPYTRLDINTSCLNDEVEIIEEDKKILMLPYPHIEIESNADDEIRDYLYKLTDKLNEIINYIQEDKNGL